MRNIRKKRSTAWGIVILTFVLNIAIIKTVNNNQDFLWLLIISVALLILALYTALSGNRSFLSFNKGSGSFAQHPQSELLSHSIYPIKITKDDLRVLIGNEQCSKPYNACLLSIEGWENTNYSVSHTELNGKESETPGRIKLSFPNKFYSSSVGSTWQVDATYQGCRTENGNFDSLAFKRIAGMPGVKMIEINLNSSVSPDHWAGSILGMTNPIGANEKPDLFAGSCYTTFRDAEGLVHFIENLRNLSGRKPIGIRLSINDKKDFRKICHAIRKTQIIPDFIVITGPSGKAAFNHPDLRYYSEMPLYEALLFVSQTLQTYGLDEDMKVIAAGKVISGFDLLKMLALGANSVRADSNCFNVPELGNRHELESPYSNSNFHYRLMKELVQIMNVGGFRSIKDVTLSKFLRRLDVLHSKRYTQTEEQIMYGDSVKKIFYDKEKKFDFEKRKSQEKISLQ